MGLCTRYFKFKLLQLMNSVLVSSALVLLYCFALDSSMQLLDHSARTL
jgi:hypothetical protein